jgi:carbon-monoxide dehydrogenase small subunit
LNIHFTLNGIETDMETPADRRVVDLLREEMGLTGVKECCGSGECGACTILVDGKARLSCLMLAAQLSKRNVITIEGISASDDLHPIQKSFVENGAVQCGFCTPGMVLSTVDLLTRNPAPSSEDIREGLSGNLCRCTGYQMIVEAVRTAAEKLRGDAS